MNLRDITEELKKFVTLDRFLPVERVVYGATGLILSAVVLSLVYLVVKK